MSVLTAQHLPKKVEKKSWYDWTWRSRKPGNADPASISASKVNADSSSKVRYYDLIADKMLM